MRIKFLNGIIGILNGLVNEGRFLERDWGLGVGCWD